jgi:hypothetical protein
MTAMRTLVALLRTMGGARLCRSQLVDPSDSVRGK